MKYKSELIKEIVGVRGHEKSSLHYESEWLNYIALNPVGEFPYVILSDVTEAITQNLALFIGVE